MRRTPTLVWLLLVLGLAVGCARVPPLPTRVAPSSAQELLTRLQARAREVQSFTAKGRVTVLTPERKYNGTALITAVKPGTLRVDVLSFFGQPLVTFYTDGQEVKLFAYTEGKLYRGPATARNLALFIPPQVTVAEVIAFMSGTVPLAAVPGAELTAEPGQDQYQVEMATPPSGERLTLWVGGPDLEIRRALWRDPQGVELFRVEFQDFQRQNGGPQPHQVELTSGPGDRKMRVRYQDFTPNPSQLSALMNLPGPEGLRETLLPQ